MQDYSWIIQNKELLKLIYSVIIILICFVIVLKTNRLFKLSLHQGIRYFRNAFFFYGIAFFLRYIVGSKLIFNSISSTQNYFIIGILFEFFLIMAGFFLLYSLIWRKIEGVGKKEDSSLINSKILLFYIMSFIISYLDFLWKAYFFMFLSQILIFVLASVISYLNYKNLGNKRLFLKFYFIAMLLSLTAWILNALLSLYFNWNQGVLINIYLINILIFGLFLYGVVKFTKRK